MSSKEVILEVVGGMPDGATIEEIVEQIQILAAIRRGKQDIEAGRFVTHNEAKDRFERWLAS